MSEERTFTQEDVNKLVGEARIKAREIARAEYEAQVAKDREAATQAALAEQQEWQQLAEKHGARVTELEPLETRVKEYETLIKGMLKDSIEELGDAAKKAIGALPEGMTAIEKLNWLNKNAELFQGADNGLGTPKRPLKSRRGTITEPRRVTSL